MDLILAEGLTMRWESVTDSQSDTEWGGLILNEGSDTDWEVSF